MNTTQMAQPLLAAQAKVDDLAQQERAASARRVEAKAHLADLQSRNHSGDHSVTGLDLITARGEVETAEGLLVHATSMLTQAQGEAAALLAEKTAREVRNSLVDFDMDRSLRDAKEALDGAVRAVTEAVTARDTLSDAVGQNLADAGVPAGQWVNGILYEPVRTNSSKTILRSTGDVMYMGAVIPGRYNVAVKTQEGGIAWLAGEGLTRNSSEVIDSILEQAWESVRS